MTDTSPHSGARATRSVLVGIGVSSGTAVGPVVQVRPAPGPDRHEPPTTDVDEELGRVRIALDDVAGDLLARAGRAGDRARPVLEATAMMARDPGLTSAVEARLRGGAGVTHAVDAAVDEYADMFTSLGGYMAERVADLEDVRDRTICRLRGLPEPGVPDLTTPAVLVARDLAPAETAGLDPEMVRGIVTSAGGPTSHTAILAAQLGIPAVVQVRGAADIPVGTQLALDGGAGEVVLNPTEEDRQRLADRDRRRSVALAGISGDGATRDGTPIAVLANIATADDACSAAASEVEGAGLFRTEFLFLDRGRPPTLQEQTRTYTQVFQAFGGRRVVVRTLDVGADKSLPFADLGQEDNPALGRRGLRLSMIREDLLETQLAALAAAHRATVADVRVMAPMVSTVEEAEWFSARVRAAGLPSVGVMVEVPAAAVCAQHLLSVVDFASIGTNDLSQYAMAADRMQGELAPLLDPWQPALLHLVRSTCEGGRTTGKPVGVCGEAAGDPVLALVLVGLGVSSLSMAPGKVRAVRAALRLHDDATCTRMADEALAARTATAAREAALTFVHPDVLDLL